MNKEEFSGNLQGISPGLIIDEGSKDESQSFFLILGSIFNDLKGLIFFQKLVEDNYRKPELNEVSAHAGEYNGLIAQADKLLIATVGEFFIFLEKNKSFLGSYKFLLLLKKLNIENRNCWNDLIKLNGGSTILSKIARVRSNVAFHYDHSMEEIKKGFIKSFFSDRKDLPQHKKAYFSFGNTMKETRIYYSDAAVADYIHHLLDIKDRAEIKTALDRMNRAIQGLLYVYIESIKR